MCPRPAPAAGRIKWGRGQAAHAHAHEGWVRARGKGGSYGRTRYGRHKVSTAWGVGSAAPRRHAGGGPRRIYRPAGRRRHRRAAAARKGVWDIGAGGQGRQRKGRDGRGTWEGCVPLLCTAGRQAARPGQLSGAALSWRPPPPTRHWWPQHRARPSARARAPQRAACHPCEPRRRLPPCRRGAACRPCGRAGARARGARSCGPCRCAASGCGACTAGAGGWVGGSSAGSGSVWEWRLAGRQPGGGLRSPPASLVPCDHAPPMAPPRTIQARSSPAPYLAGLGLEVVQGAELLAQQLLELQQGQRGRSKDQQQQTDCCTCLGPCKTIELNGVQWLNHLSLNGGCSGKVWQREEGSARGNESGERPQNRSW